MGADCKSVDLCLRRFESFICHSKAPDSRRGPSCFTSRMPFRDGRAFRALVLAKALADGGQRRQTAMAEILRPRNLFQPHATTAVDRYPEELEVVAGAVPDPARILSFGCSSGEELLSVQSRFPDARITGIDVNPLAVRTARKRVRAAGLGSQVTLRRAGDASAEQPASYDVVLALAVFRHADLNAAPPHCEPVLSYADFERTVEGLAACVRPGGLLVLRHANFRFSDCPAAASYELVAGGYGSAGEGGLPTPVYGPDGTLLPFSERDDGVYRKRLG